MVLLVKSEGIGTKGRPEKPAATTALINRAAGMNAQIWVRIIGRIYSLIFFLAYSFVTSAINIFLPIGADYRDRYSRMNFIRWKDPVLYISLRFRYAPRSCNYRNVDEKRDVQSARVSFAQRGGGALHFQIDSVVSNFPPPRKSVSYNEKELSKQPNKAHRRIHIFLFNQANMKWSFCPIGIRFLSDQNYA